MHCRGANRTNGHANVRYLYRTSCLWEGPSNSRAPGKAMITIAGIIALLVAQIHLTARTAFVAM